MSDESLPSVLTERYGHVLVITINRSHALNAVNADVHVGIGRALAEADANSLVRAVVLTGAGDRAFCAGADLKAVSRGESLFPDDPVERSWGFGGYVQHHICKPTIAAMNGSSYGGGTELVLASDLAIAAEAVELGLPEVKRGLIAAAGGAFRLASHLPPKVALEMLLTGNAISAERALEFGLINAVVAREQLLPTAIRLAEEIAGNAPLAVQATKRIAWQIIGGSVASEEARWRQTEREMERLFRSRDTEEGVRAFNEKRPPVWLSQ